MRDGIQHKKAKPGESLRPPGFAFIDYLLNSPYGQVTVRWNGESVGVTPVLSKVCT